MTSLAILARQKLNWSWLGSWTSQSQALWMCGRLLLLLSLKKGQPMWRVSCHPASRFKSCISVGGKYILTHSLTVCIKSVFRPTVHWCLLHRSGSLQPWWNEAWASAPYSLQIAMKRSGESQVLLWNCMAPPLLEREKYTSHTPWPMKGAHCSSKVRPDDLYM